MPESRGAPAVRPDLFTRAPVHARNLSLLLAAVMAAQAVLGLLLPEQYRDAAWVRATWYGNDLVTLFVAAPLLSIAPGHAGRGWLRAELVWYGVIAYAIYNDAYYMLGAALNVFFPLYLLAFVLGVAALVRALTAVAPAAIAARFRIGGGRKIIAAYFILVGAGLAVAWLGMWAAHVFAGRPTPIETEAFRLVAALDLTLIAPTFALGGILLWRHAPWGFVVAPLAGVLGALYLLVLTVNSALQLARSVLPWPGELPVWGSLFGATTAATIALLAAARAR